MSSSSSTSSHRGLNYGCLKGEFSGAEHVAYDYKSGRPAHLIFYLKTSSGVEKQVAFNVFSISQSEVFVHFEKDLSQSENVHLRNLSLFAEKCHDQLLLKNKGAIPIENCIDLVDLNIGFPGIFTQEKSELLIKDLNDLFEISLHELHETKGRQKNCSS